MTPIGEARLVPAASIALIIFKISSSRCDNKDSQSVSDFWKYA